MTNRDDVRVLIVDDEESVRFLLEHVLADMGCETASVETAKEGWERILEKPRLDLVLLDKNLPDRSGLDLLAEAKGHDPDLEIVMITGYASLDAAVTALRLGAGDFFTKPFDDLPVLKGKIGSALERARRARERTELIADLKDREAALEGLVAERTSELEAAFVKLRRRDADRRRLMADVSHDLRTPLTTIQGYLEMLLGGNVREELREPYLRSILGQCKRLGRLTRDLAFLSRQADGQLDWKPRMVCVKSLFEEASRELMLLFEQIDVSIDSAVEEGAKRVWADEDRLMQVLTNLLANASKFAPNGSTVRLRAEADEGVVLLSVSDEGKGVPKDQRSAVFERYHSGDESGRGEGIGLSICKDIVASHKGRIWVEDSDEGGARFKVLLPAEGRALE